MRTGAVNVREIAASESRLTAGLFLSEDQQAMRALARFPRTDRLGALTHGRGVFRGPIFRRVFAADPELGRPYVSASDLVQADIRPTEHLSQRHGALLDALALHEGMILVTCSGMNLGRALWTRADMDGLCASHDLIRIEPDASSAPPGYLYAFLASRHGRVAIRRQIFGGNIKHVEPHHVANLRVPRLDAAQERAIHERVVTAASERTQAHAKLREAQESFRRAFGLSDLSHAPTSTQFVTFAASSSSLARLHAGYLHPACTRATHELATCSQETRALGEVVRVFTPGIFKRIHVNDPTRGYPYFTGGGIFQAEPLPRGYLSRKAPDIDAYLIRKDWLLIQDAGQLDGLMGRVARVNQHLADAAASNNLVRIIAPSRSDAGYTALVLQSPHGYRAITRLSFGSSIPHLDAGDVARIRLPWPAEQLRTSLARPVVTAWDLQDQADARSAEATALVERAIEAG